MTSDNTIIKVFTENLEAINNTLEMQKRLNGSVSKVLEQNTIRIALLNAKVYELETKIKQLEAVRND